MILVDTSVWIDHLRYGDTMLAELLKQNEILMHPMVLGELACGNLQNRSQLLLLWMNLPQVKQASHQEVMICIEHNKLMGLGIGYVDVHLIAATLLQSDAVLWTRDKRLHKAAEKLGLALTEH